MQTRISENKLKKIIDEVARVLETKSSINSEELQSFVGLSNNVARASSYGTSVVPSNPM